VIVLLLQILGRPPYFFLFSQYQLVKIIFCSFYCLIFLGFFTCFIYTKFTTSRHQYTKVGLEKGTAIAAQLIVVLFSRDADKSFCIYTVVHSLPTALFSLHSKNASLGFCGTNVEDPDPPGSALILVGWIRFRIQKSKNDPQKKKKVKNFHCFEVVKCSGSFYYSLDVLWRSGDKCIAALIKNIKFFQLVQLHNFCHQIPGSGSALTKVDLRKPQCGTNIIFVALCGS
jgi:hypothetical protein